MANDVVDQAMDSVSEQVSDAKQVAKDAAQNVENAVEKTESAAKSAESKVLDTVDAAQEKLGKATPVSTNIGKVASPSDINSRLKWGEPALTILDVRDRAAFNQERIMGANWLPKDDLASRAESSFDKERDIYIYGETAEKTAAAMQQLESLGFEKVSGIDGGLEAWKAINAPTEGQIQKDSSLEGLLV